MNTQEEHFVYTKDTTQDTIPKEKSELRCEKVNYIGSKN